jgi:hypothetical protein
MLILKFILHFLILLLSGYAASSQFAQELASLDAIKNTFNSAALNTNWTGTPCSSTIPQPWLGVTCTNDHVSGILLENFNLTGEILYNALFNLTALTSVSFKNNSISGNVLNFTFNQNLTSIDLSYNRFYGPISNTLLNLDSLESLQLQNNSLTGSIPGFNQTSLVQFNVSNNNLRGLIPKTPALEKFDYSSYRNNPGLCGKPTSFDCNGKKIPPSGSPIQGAPPPSSESNFTVAFLLFDVICLLAVMLLFILYWKKRSQLKAKMLEESSNDADVEEGPESCEEKSLKTTEFPNVKTVVVRDQEKGKLIFNSGELEQTFELSDLLKASAEGLGKGIFGNTYKAKLDGDRGKSVVVVKRLRDLKPLTGEEFERQLQIFSRLKHPNLLPLVAHYYAEEEKLLLFKYAPNGNLFSRIHGERGPDRIPFRWSARLSVSRGVARALEYLHASINTKNSAPHGNLKPSNILFDENDTVLVSDYGFASIVATPIAVDRMLAYKSPEYQSSKKMSKKSDVWSYGFLILELLTGRISIHSAPPGFQGIDLTGWVHRAVREEWTGEIFDSEINGQRAAASGMLKLLQIAIRCCDKVPENRPEMSEVVREVGNIKFVESEDESDVSVDDLTDESRSTIGSGIVADKR